MTKAQRRILRHYVIAALIGVGATTIFAIVQKGDGWDFLAGVLVAVLISFGAYLVEHRFGRKLQRLSFFASFLGHLAGYLASALASFYVGILIARMLERRAGPLDRTLQADMLASLGDPVIVSAYGWALAVMVALVAHRELARKLGPGVLPNWLLGRYHMPRKEERIFLFVDLKDSTALAEKMGDLKFSRFVREFLADVSDAVVETCGEVSHYIGDEAVVTWRMRQGLDEANCIQCFFLAQEMVDRRAAWYDAEFGQTPKFKAGLHGGDVVVTEVGTLKSEIVYHGDVVNTTARIQSLCAETDSALLVSGWLLTRLTLPAGFAAHAVGEFVLKGRDTPVHLHAIRKIIPSA